MLVSLSWSIFIFDDFAQFFSYQPSLLFVVKCEIPENPLDVCYVQYFAEKLPNPLFSIHSVIPQDKVLILNVKVVSWDPSFHEVLPVYDVLAFSQTSRLWRHAPHLCHLLDASLRTYLGTQYASSRSVLQSFHSQSCSLSVDSRNNLVLSSFGHRHRQATVSVHPQLGHQACFPLNPL